MRTNGTARHLSRLTAGFAAGLLFWASQPGGAQERYRPAFSTYGIAEGLSNAVVGAILQDDYGFLWVGTHDGLNRFDGVEFTAYKARLDSPDALVDDFIEAVAQADSGRIWVGAQRGGLQLFDPLTEQVRHFPMTELGPWRLDDADGAAGERPGRRVRHILPLGGRQVLMLTDVGLVSLQTDTGSATLLDPAAIPGASLPHATALCATPSGAALIARSDGSLATWEGDVQTLVPGIAFPDSVVILRSGPEGFLAGTFAGNVFLLDEDLTEVRELVRMPPGPARYLRDLLSLPDGSIWLATSDGAFVARGGSVARIGDREADHRLPDQEVSALLVDRTGVIWVGTWGGMASVNPLSSTMDRVLMGLDLAGDAVIPITGAGEGRVWAGTYEGGVQLIETGATNGERRAHRPTSLDALADAQIFGLGGGGNDPLWIAAFTDGLWILQGEDPVRRLTVLGIDGSEVFVTALSAFVDHADDVWAGTLAHGLLRWDPDAAVFRQYRGQSSWDLGSDYVWPIAEDARGRLWVGAYNGGLSMVSRDRSTSTLYRPGPDGLSESRILTIFIDSRDHVWVGTEGGGLNHLDPETGVFHVWTVDDGLPHDNVEGILEDTYGRMWVSTTDGIARFDPATADEFLVLREPAGLAGNRHYANAAYRDSEGRLYFGGPAGITIIDPAQVNALGRPPDVALTAFRIQGRREPLARAVRTEELVLQPNERFFAFEFAALDFADASQNRYRYKLDGLDPDWVDAGGSPMANYTSVPPARYVFRVAARNSEGIWNEDALALPVRVLAPYYQTWWFRTLAAASVLAMLLGAYTYRLKQLEARQNLRLEVAGKLHDDIGANLSNIALKAEIVRATAGLADRPKTLAGDVGRLARETAHKVRETVWVVNTRYDTLPRLVSHMRDTADTLLSGHVAFAFSAPEDIPDQSISMEFRQNVHLLFKEALNNTVKHAAAEQVDIVVTLPLRRLAFRVVDDGIGFDPSAAEGGNGQRLMRGRAEKVRGTLEVTSRPGEGTTVAFSARLR